MANPKIRAVRIVKGDNVLHVHGELAGQEGVYLAKGQVHGLYDAPVKTTYITGAFQEGSTHRFTKKGHRDLEIGFHIKETFNLYELNDSALRRMFDYEIDRWDPDYEPTRIEVETDLSGIRKLDVYMYEEPDFGPDLDPIGDQYGNVIFKLRAPDPMWYEDMQTDSFAGVTTTGTGHVTVENPTDNIMYHKWVLTPAHWTLPDYQWEGTPGAREPSGANANRTISGINVTDGNGGITIDLDRGEPMYRDANDTNALGQFGSTKIFYYPIPPYTPATDLPVAYSAAPDGGAEVQLKMVLRWSRPWGLEIPAESASGVVFTPQSIAFITDYTYQIPTGCDTIDVILAGGGGGGDGGTLIPVNGGKAGPVTGFTLVRGVDIPWSTEVITGVIGQGGRRGNALLNEDPTDGGTTTAVATGMVTLEGVGGEGGGYTRDIGETSAIRYNGREYSGGAGGLLGENGHAPSAGGGAGFPFGPGGYGARGKAWFYAYKSGS